MFETVNQIDLIVCTNVLMLKEQKYFFSSLLFDLFIYIRLFRIIIFLFCQIKVLNPKFVPIFSVLEAGIRLPRGVTQGNLLDLGNYHQCLGINKDVEHMTIEGKYCRFSVGLNEDFINRINYSKIKLDEEINLKREMLKTHTIRSTNDWVQIDEVDGFR